MKRALKVCSCVGCPEHPGSCPELVTAGRCSGCGREAERARGTRQQRGYNAEHDGLRRQWVERLKQGQYVECHAVTCLLPSRVIDPSAPWDLGHTDDRTAWTGPEHIPCNRSAGGKAAHRYNR